jgi:pyruvate/2-oxoacid:ferredoxin oxidoreductase alpha subunit
MHKQEVREAGRKEEEEEEEEREEIEPALLPITGKEQRNYIHMTRFQYCAQFYDTAKSDGVVIRSASAG